jgi:DNA repair protein SbcC/Rad50
MRITVIYIENFGKISKTKFEFHPNQNLIYGKNEQGKSTMMAFIRAMLYGLPGSTIKDLLRNDRKKYSPWNKGPYGGYLEMESEGLFYRIERNFGEVPRKDTLKVMNLSTNSSQEIPDREEPGRYFLKMSGESFDNSIYIGQLGSVFDHMNSTDNEIIQKLQNLATTGNETQSFHQINARLQTASEKIKAKRGKNGELDRLIREKGDLDQAKFQALQMEEHKKQRSEEYRLLKLKKEELKNQITECNERINQIRQCKSAREMKQFLEKIEELKELEKESASLKNDLEKNGKIPTLIQLESIKTTLLQLLNEQSYIRQKTQEIRMQSIELEPSGIQEIDPMQEQEIEKAFFLENQITEKRKILTQMQEDIEEMKRLLLKEQDYLNRLHQEQLRKDMLTTRHDKNSPKQFHKPVPIHWLIAGIGVLLAGILAGSLLHALFFVLSGISLTGFAVWGIHNQYKTQIEKKRKETGYDHFLDEKAAIDENIHFITNEIKEIRVKISNLFNYLKNNRIENPDGQIIQYEKMLLNNSNEIEAIIRHMEQICMKYGANSIPELKLYYEDAENKKKKREISLENLHKQQEQLDQLIDAHQSKAKAFIDDQRTVLGIFELDHAAEILDRITDLHYRYHSLNRIISERQRDLRYALNSKTEIQIRNEYHNIINELTSQGIAVDDPHIDTEWLVNVQKQHDEMNQQLRQTEVEMATLKADILHRFAGEIQISEIDEQLEINIARQKVLRQEYEAILEAQKALEKAFQRMQQNFGPIVNRKCSAIFSRLTGGRYNEILVSKDLEMSVRDPLLHSTLEWKYLSSGTIDQLYFSLRFAIAEVFSENAKGLPVFLDDSFLQYDDERARNAFNFLTTYTPEHQLQVFFFTCHRAYADFVAKETNHITLFFDKSVNPK